MSASYFYRETLILTVQFKVLKDQQGHGTSKNPEAQCQTKFTQYALKKISCQKVTFENDFFRLKIVAKVIM